MTDYPLERAPLSVCPDCGDVHRNSHTLCARCERARLRTLAEKFKSQTTGRANDPDAENNTTDTPQHSS